MSTNPNHPNLGRYEWVPVRKGHARMRFATQAKAEGYITQLTRHQPNTVYRVVLAEQQER